MKTGLSISKDAMGAFVDAVYAIAVTILALELPNSLDSDAELVEIGILLINYAISFFILFALWVQHRRINLHIANCGNVVLWLNACILLLVCLLPRATTFVFEYGNEVGIEDLEQAAIHFSWTLPNVIDLGFILIVIISDLGLIALLHLIPKQVRDAEAADIYKSKVTISILLILVMAASLFFPLENRFFLVMLPVFLMFEHRISGVVEKLKAKSARAG